MEIWRAKEQATVNFPGPSPGDYSRRSSLKHVSGVGLAVGPCAIGQLEVDGTIGNPQIRELPRRIDRAMVHDERWIGQIRRAHVPGLKSRIRRISQPGEVSV